MKVIRYSIGLALWGLIPASILAAQSADDKTPIVVVARPEPREKTVRHLVDHMTAMTNGQVARFTTSVCFGVDGFVAPHDETVRYRLEKDARLAKLDVRAKGCKPNVMIVLVDDGKTLVNTLFRQRPRLFADQSLNERRTLMSETGPVRVITTTDLRGAEGQLPSKFGPPGVNIAGASYYLPVQSASIIDVPMRQDILWSMILIDNSAVLGKSLKQIADYAVMRTLARLRGVEAVTSEPTILSLFAHNAPSPPAELTTWDRGYLTGLYEGNANRAGYAKKAEIAEAINARIREKSKINIEPQSDQ
ncbi:hypothetical protein [Sphingomonas sp. PAMC 26621]|uniref:hypothetical protein n=1 Tax=Sphingomonas sp. PAMC 26621 TaxID=1112213 RepID=UPI00111114E1|nr:hypothetical protein [Sphingomonas sp. PAMC 26621]